MAAITKRLLHLRPNFQPHARPHPYPLQHFSSSSDPDSKSDISQPDPNSESRHSFSSSINSVKASLHQSPPLQNRDNRSPSPSRDNSNDYIRHRISEFRRRSAAPPPSSSTGFSMQDFFERNSKSKGDGSANSSGSHSGGNPSLESIRLGLRLNPGAQNDSSRKLPWSMSQSTENLMRRPDANANMDLKSLSGLDLQDMGKKLKMLRPQNRKGKWFSLQELSDRLAKVKEAQKEDNEVIASIRVGLGAPKRAERKPPSFRIVTGGTESYDMLPPKTDLVEQYFHPDNLSSAEKLKLELQKVREEFKMSESDCGSTRVQVAQLTLKIKHLSNVLQKKDKHSRKGLQGMVERRKKLLKYLRRTDWDSYCLVLSKLALRDNPT